MKRLQVCVPGGRSAVASGEEQKPWTPVPARGGREPDAAADGNTGSAKMDRTLLTRQRGM